MLHGMSIDKLPATLIGAGAFLAGLWLGQAVADPTLALVAGGVAAALIALGTVLRLPAVKHRWPQLAPKRSRLARLHLHITEIRSELKRSHAAGTVDVRTWEPGLRAFVEGYWRRLDDIEPDDWRREKLKITDFDLVHRNGGDEPSKWGMRMLEHLQRLRTLTEERKDKYPLA